MSSVSVFLTQYPSDREQVYYLYLLCECICNTSAHHHKQRQTTHISRHNMGLDLDQIDLAYAVSFSRFHGYHALLRKICVIQPTDPNQSGQKKGLPYSEQAPLNLSAAQLDMLEQIYQRTPYPGIVLLTHLASRLNHSVMQLLRWFHDRRKIAALAKRNNVRF